MPTVKVLQSVSHGRYHLHEGETRDDVAQADINTLKELGFVEDVAPQAVAPTPEAWIEQAEQPEAETKMEGPVLNKMDAPAANKTSKAKAK